MQRNECLINNKDNDGAIDKIFYCVREVYNNNVIIIFECMWIYFDVLYTFLFLYFYFLLNHCNLFIIKL